MAQVTSVNVDANAPTHAEAAAKLVAAASEIEYEEPPAASAPSRIRRRQ